MDRRLFTEEALSRGIPRAVMELIDGIDGTTDPTVFDEIFESTEATEFLKSLCAPGVTEHCHISVLLQDVKKKGILKSDKSKRPSKKGQKAQGN